LEERDLDVHLPKLTHQQFDEREMKQLVQGMDGIIAGDDVISASVIGAGSRLRVISKWGVGVDAIDLPAAAERGITVTNTPGVFGEDVADAALGYLLSLTRHITRIHQAVARGGWLKVEGTRLSGKTVGVLGFGSIGRATARRLVAFGCHTIAYDAYPSALTNAESMGVTPVALDELLRRSEALIVCAPLNADTYHLVNAESLAKLPPGALFVNVSRGPLVDERALIDALASGHVAGAGLDVFEEEPLAPESPLRKFDQCIFGSHNGSNTREGVLECSQQAVSNLLVGLGIE
jgi:D-3-phosphoglycerate dehydrogenase